MRIDLYGVEAQRKHADDALKAALALLDRYPKSDAQRWHKKVETLTKARAALAGHARAVISPEPDEKDQATLP